MPRPTMPFGELDYDYIRQLATTPPESDGPIWMVNFMRYRERADYGADGDQGISGREADDRYAPTDVLADLGADVTFFANVVAPSETWHRLAIVRYPTRKSFIDMQGRRDFQERYVHKEAGMAFTIITASLPETLRGTVTGDQVTFVAHPLGATPPPLKSGATFVVEGVPVGDQRRFGRLDVTWGDPGPVPDGALWARTRPIIDRIGEFFSR